MDFKVVITQIIVLFIVIGIGVLVRKLGIIDDDTSKSIASLVINVTAPALIMNALRKSVDLSFKQFMQLILISVCSYTFLFLVTILLPKILKVKKGDIGIFKFMIFFSNVAFIGFPVISSVYDDSAISLASILNLPFYFMIYTLGVYFVSIDHETDHKFELKKLISPAVISVIIGLLLLATGIELPKFATKTLDMVGGLTTPLAMIVIGSSLANSNVKKIVKNYKLLILSIYKLLINPILLYLILRGLGFEGLMLGVPVIVFGMPIASNAVIISKKYGGNDLTASEGVFVSTLLSLITIPILAYIIAL